MNPPQITKISLLHLPFITEDSYEVLINLKNLDKTKHRVIVQVNMKNYEPDGNTVIIKMPKKSGLAAANNLLRIKAFVYDFANDKVVQSKLQEFVQGAATPQLVTSLTARAFETDNQTTIFNYVPIDELLSTVPEILGLDRVLLQKKQKINNGANYNITGYWSSDKNGKKKITEANLGSQVFFHIQTENIDDNTDLILRLSDNDGLLKPDTRYPKVIKDEDTRKNIIIKTEIDKLVTIKKNKATISLVLDENWAPMIEKDAGVHIELQWKAYSISFEKTIDSILNVGYSLRYLYINPPLENYTLPEMLTEDGKTIVFALGDFYEIDDKVSKKIEEWRYFIGARILETGKLVTNVGEIYNRKNSIYKYNIYTNEAKAVKLSMASNFGFKIKFVKDGKPLITTTKGLSQIDYFVNKSARAGMLKVGIEVLEIWELQDLTAILFSNGIGEIPIGILPTPISFAYELLNLFVIKPFAEGIIEDLVLYSFIKFENCKQKGLDYCLEFARTDAAKLMNLKKPIRITSKTLNVLIKGEFLELKELVKYNDNSMESLSDAIHTLFYRSEKDKYRGDDIFIVEAIFIGNKILKE